jgi:serine/threonine protein kinase
MTERLDSAPTDRNPEAEAALPAIPEHQLLRFIGEGSGGQVWLARNVIGAYRAVKIVQKNAIQPSQQFTREFTGLSKFEPVSRLHDGLMDILQIGVAEAAGYFYCVMELADDVQSGQLIVPERYVPRTLAYDLAQRRRLPIGECVRNGAAIASALAFLHRHDLIHRDIKPSNIIFVKGRPKLADIGLVAATSEAKSFVGTQGFLAPEGPGDPPADIYSLGKVLYEMAMGRDRCRFPELPTTLAEDPDREKLLALNEILIKACETEVGARYASAAEMRADLERLSRQWQAEEQQSARPRPSGPTP